MIEVKYLLIGVGDSLMGHTNLDTFIPEGTSSYMAQLNHKLGDDVYTIQCGYGGQTMTGSKTWIHQWAMNIHAFNQFPVAYVNKHQVKITPNTKIATVWQFGTNDARVWEDAKTLFKRMYELQLTKFNDGKHFVALIPSLWDSNACNQSKVNDEILQIDVTKIDHTNLNNKIYFSDKYHPNQLGVDMMVNNALPLLRSYFKGGVTPTPTPIPIPTNDIAKLLDENDRMLIDIKNNNNAIRKL